MKKPFRLEEKQDLLIAYTGNQHMDTATYQRFLNRWAERLDEGQAFGVILVYEEHNHDLDHNHERRDAAEEDRMTRAIGDFRRTYREKIAKTCSGFSRVFPTAWLEGMSEEEMEKYQDRSNHLSKYMFGIRGNNFTALEDAKQWLADKVPLNLGIEKKSRADSKIGFYYGSTTGITELVAEKMLRLAEKAGIVLNPINISNLKDAQELLEFQKLILGIPTWNVGQLQDDWLLLFPQLDHLNFHNKQIALFGVGDQKGYPNNFLDALGTLAIKLQERGAELVGYWSADDYTFENSKALIGSKLRGLGIDEYNQEDKTEQRIRVWLEQIIDEFNWGAKELEIEESDLTACNIT